MWQTALLYALGNTAEGDSGGATNPLGQMIAFMVMIFAIMYFLMIRPQQKRDRQRREMLAALSKGDKVITNGGIYGTIVGLNEKTVVLKVSDDPLTKIEFARGSVSQVAKEDDGREN